MLKNGSKYYFSSLSDGEKNLYNRTAEAISRFEPALSIHAGMGKDFVINIEKILRAVFFDNPGFFYLDRNRIVVKQTPMYIQLCFTYDYTEAQAEDLSSRIKETLVDFMCEYIEPRMSPLAKQLSVYRYLQSFITPQKEERDKDSYSIIGALIRRSCVCEGFAKAYKLLCDYLRIASIVVTGEAMGEGAPIPHAWNITRINGVTAHSDITWDTMSGPGSYDYFNLCDADIAADHSFAPDLYPKCNPNKINYFYKNGLIAATKDEAKKIIKQNAACERLSIKLLYAVPNEQIQDLGFPPGSLRFNRAHNVLTYKR